MVVAREHGAADDDREPRGREEVPVRGRQQLLEEGDDVDERVVVRVGQRREEVGAPGPQALGVGELLLRQQRRGDDGPRERRQKRRERGRERVRADVRQGRRRVEGAAHGVDVGLGPGLEEEVRRVALRGQRVDEAVQLARHGRGDGRVVPVRAPAAQIREVPAPGARHPGARDLDVAVARGALDVQNQHLGERVDGGVEPPRGPRAHAHHDVDEGDVAGEQRAARPRQGQPVLAEPRPRRRVERRARAVEGPSHKSPVRRRLADVLQGDGAHDFLAVAHVAEVHEARERPLPRTRVAVAVAGDVVQQLARHLRRPRRVEPVEGRDHGALDGALLRREDLEHARAQARAHGLVVRRLEAHVRVVVFQRDGAPALPEHAVAPGRRP